LGGAGGTALWKEFFGIGASCWAISKTIKKKNVEINRF
jgi:hypothetical protein